MRYALYRLIVQGMRRCIGNMSLMIRIGSLSPRKRQFFSGSPLWEFVDIDGKRKLTTRHPEGYARAIDANNGAFYWIVEDSMIFDTPVVWDSSN